MNPLFTLLTLLFIGEAPTGFIPVFNAKVTALRFFESGYDATPRELRVYANRFEKQKTRYVHWELNLEFPELELKKFLTVDEFWYNPAGHLLKRQQAYSTLEPAWTWSYHSHSYGSNDAGNLPAGTYRVNLFVDQKNVASGSFEIYDTVSPETYFKKGTDYFDKGQYNEAILELTRAIESNPKFADAYVKRGQAYLKNVKYKEAIADFTKVIQINPQDSAGYTHRAGAYLNQGEYFKALTDLDAGIELNSKDHSAYVYRGIIYMKQKLYEQAISDFNKVIEMDPKNAESYAHRGECYYQIGQFEKALDDLKEAQALGYQVDPNMLQELQSR